jgi:hypothetical protein
MCSTLKNALQHPTVLMSSGIITGIGCFSEERWDWMTSCAMEVQAGLSISAQDPSAVPIRRFSVLLLPKILSAPSSLTERHKCLKWCVLQLSLLWSATPTPPVYLPLHVAVLLRMHHFPRSRRLMVAMYNPSLPHSRFCCRGKLTSADGTTHTCNNHPRKGSYYKFHALD